MLQNMAGFDELSSGQAQLTSVVTGAAFMDPGAILGQRCKIWGRTQRIGSNLGST